jgi:sphinganine-1-phosphate aldolase
VYYASDEVAAMAAKAYSAFAQENTLAVNLFPSMALLREELLGALAALLNAPAVHGVLTTGGTESNLVAVWAAAARARTRGVAAPTIVVPYSAHPSFYKAASLLGIQEIRVPTTSAFVADLKSVRNAITRDTALLVASAPAYSHGLVDPVEELGAVALEHDVPLHVDACLGSFVLPFLADLGREVPEFDFSVQGVTSISADLHKQGFAPKGISAVLFRDPESRRLTLTRFENWPSGRYVTEGLAGSKSGGVLAAAWAVMQHLGREGYVAHTAQLMKVTDAFRRGIEQIPVLEILGEPLTNKFAYTAQGLDVLAVAECLEQSGWITTIQQGPPAINMHLQAYHGAIVDRYLRDLAKACERVATGRLRSTGRRASYSEGVDPFS